MKHLIDNFEIKEFNNNKWLAIYEKNHYVINEDAKNLFEIIKQSSNMNIALDNFNIKYNLSLNLNELEKIIITFLNKIGVDFKKKTIIPIKSYLKLKLVLLNAKVCNLLSKGVQCLIHEKSFYVIFSIVLLFNIIFYFLLKNLNFSYNIPINENLIAIPLLFLAVLLHELGHIGASEKFGAKNGGIGIGVFLIFPVVFADVTNSWKLSKSKRIITSLSGVYIQSVFSILLFLIAIVLNVKLFYSLAVYVFIGGLFQLFPFIKSDGYWVVSDFFEIYNLKQKSNLWGLYKNWEKIENKKLFLLTYGILDFLLLFLYLFTMIVLNFDYFINFPVLFYNLLININLDTSFFEKIEMNVIFYLLLYYMLLNLLIVLIFKYIKKLVLYFK
jgi:putative peptide zinc metalloprotease protein